MKGIVFTEFIEMVEQKFGLETVDTIIESSELPSKGIYTSVGTYDFAEMAALVTALSKETNIEINQLLHVYGLYFFDVLLKTHPKIYEYYDNAFDLLAGIEKHIHVHVRKIYPDAELPYFDVKEQNKNRLVLEYQSERGMYSFCLGLMERTLAHFNEQATIGINLIKPDGTKVVFTLDKNDN